MKKNQNRNQKKTVEQGATLKDALNADILEKLQAAKSSLKEEEENRQKEEQARKIEERKQREKNKTFEELLNENPMNWKQYK